MFFYYICESTYLDLASYVLAYVELNGHKNVVSSYKYTFDSKMAMNKIVNANYFTSLMKFN